MCSPMATRNEQAIDLISTVISEIIAGDPDLVRLLRSCFHATGLTGWSEAQSWFQHELEGFPTEATLPSYRQNIAGEIAWRPASTYDIAGHFAKRMTYGDSEEPEQTAVDIRAGMTDIVGWSGSGMRGQTLERREKEGGSKNYFEERFAIYPARAFERLVQAAQNEIFQFASSMQITLLYGDALQDVWEGYRADLEPRLAEMGLSKQLEAIREGIAADNPEKWRMAMLACRNVLQDLGGRLWRDPRANYEPLLNDKNEPIKIDEKHYINRLLAYLHYKGVTGTTGAYLRDELERINSSMHALNALASKGKSIVTREDARLAAIGTYVLIGEILLRTDGEPVEDAAEGHPPAQEVE